MKQKYPINEMIKTYLRRRGIKAIELAHMSGISRDVMYNILRGRSAVKAEDLVTICDALGITPDELLTSPVDVSPTQEESK